ncbi:MAG: hypothetical protein ACLFPL_03970 [Candidatus Nanoarchaeia archaeon]
MDITLIIYIILVLVLIVLAFKFIKKIVLAIVASVFIVLLSIAILGGLIYLDVQSLTQIEDATLNVVYLEGEEEFTTGISIPISAQEEGIDVSAIESFTQSDYESSEDLADDTFTITLKGSAFERIQDEEVSLSDVVQDESFSEVIQDELAIPVELLQQVVESPNPQEEISDVILEELSLGPVLQEGARPLLVEAIERVEEEQGLNVQEISFGLMLQKLSEDERNYLYLIRLFQDGEIEVQPNKLSFRIFRYVPLSFIESQLPIAQGNETTQETPIENN